ncbi:Hypothetical protein D9617_10g074780 [Elsinoe fawcettii]|nr:Hypothetical protein D9617_10g074780 [Elsinoe fawcettii]
MAASAITCRHIGGEYRIVTTQTSDGRTTARAGLWPEDEGLPRFAAGTHEYRPRGALGTTIRIGFVAGIGSGLPSTTNKTRLSDVVVSISEEWTRDILQYHVGNFEPQKCQTSNYTSLEVPGTIAGRRVNALADTGSSLNTIDADFASLLGLRIRPFNSAPRVRSCTGKRLVCCGYVDAGWTFLRENNIKVKTRFHVIKRSPHRLIFGAPFLKQTQTLHEHRERIFVRSTKRPRAGPICAFLQQSGDAALPRIRIPSATGDLFALADTGCETNIMSRSFAQRHNFQIDTSAGQRRMLRLANGQLQKTLGTVRLPTSFLGDDLAMAYESAPHEFSSWNMQDPESIDLEGLYHDVERDLDFSFLRFDILDVCTYDVVLGAHVIFRVGLDKLVFDEESDTGSTRHHTTQRFHSLNPIDIYRHDTLLDRWKRKWGRKETTNNIAAALSQTLTSSQAPDIETQKQAELCRRTDRAAEIERMPGGPDKDAALAEERLVQRQNAMALSPTSQSLPPALVAPPGTSSMGTATSALSTMSAGPGAASGGTISLQPLSPNTGSPQQTSRPAAAPPRPP